MSSVWQPVRQEMLPRGLLGGGPAVTIPDDPAIDLAVIAAILSSNEDIAIDKDICFAAEIGLAGEIRPVTRAEQRILEAEKLGFATIMISKQTKLPKNNYAIKIQKVAKIEDVVSYLFQ